MTRSPTRRSSEFANALLRLGCACATIAALGIGCASNAASDGQGQGTTSAKYPRRAPGCEIALYHTPVPGVSTWDDLGVTEAVCNINGSLAECMRQLKSEACRMGGDILYNVPRTPYRPRDQVLVFRGQVAHTRSGVVKTKDDPDLPPEASPEESSRPVQPLPSGDKPPP
jgi:hypothetical protein